MSLEEAPKIPGLVLTWEKTSSRAGSKYGHTAITTGDGRSSVSDFIVARMALFHLHNQADQGTSCPLVRDPL